MMAVRKHYDDIVALSQTDFTEDLSKTNVPVKARAVFLWKGVVRNETIHSGVSGCRARFKRSGIGSRDT
jgi:hypothetical protein